MTSLAEICSIEKPYSIIFFGFKFLFVNRFSFLWHLLGLLEDKRMTRSDLYVGDLEQGDTQEGFFPNDDERRVVTSLHRAPGHI